MRANLTMRRAAAGVILALAPASVLICWLLAHDELPARVATHFGIDGRPDGYSSPGPFTLGFGIAVLILSGLGIAGVVLARRWTVARTAVGLAGWTSWLIAAVVLTVIWPARDVSADVVRHNWLSTLIVLLAASAAGVATYRLMPPAPSALTSVSAPAPSYTLKPGERVTWVGRARSRTLLIIGVGIVLLSGLGLLLSGRSYTLYAAALGLLVGWSSELLVRVDDRGVSAHFGPLGWPAFRTPLERIEAVGAQDIEPVQWGGWGFRIGRRGTALVVRRGPGIVILRTGASDLAITVDGADQGAELLNALLARERAG